MASNSGFSKFVPSGTSSIAQGDDDIRSFKSHMQAWWEDEHYALDGSASSAGEHKPGSARAFSVPASLLSGEVARLGQLSHDTTNNLLFVGSGSSISNVGGAGINSINTWTALQNYTGKVKIGAAGSAISSVVAASSESLGQLVMEPSSWTTVSVNLNVALGDAHTIAYSFVVPSGAPIVHSLANEVGADLYTLVLYNPSSSTVTIADQKILVSSMTF